MASSAIICYSFQIESMSLFVGMDKHTFLEKYTEETEADGAFFTKLKHKKDLSCVMLDIGKQGSGESTDTQSSPLVSSSDE